MKVRIFLVILFITVSATAYAQNLTEEKYKEEVIMLFKELIELTAKGIVHPMIPDANFGAGNPRAKNWLKKVKDLDSKAGIFSFSEMRIPQGFSSSSVLGLDLRSLSNHLIAEDPVAFDALALKFFIVLIFHENPEIAEQYLQ